MAFPVDLRRYQHIPALGESCDDLLPDRPFREADLDRNLVLPSECKAPTIFTNLETMTFNTAYPYWNWDTWPETETDQFLSYESP